MVKRSVVCLALVADIYAFTPCTLTNGPIIKSMLKVRARSSCAQLHMTEAIDPADTVALGEASLFPPKGYGFTSTIRRILDAPNCRSGYYRAFSNETVMDVMDCISSGSEDVALVFDESSGRFLGLFAETDYLKVRGRRQIAALAILIGKNQYDLFAL